MFDGKICKYTCGNIWFLKNKFCHYAENNYPYLLLPLAVMVFSYLEFHTRAQIQQRIQHIISQYKKATLIAANCMRPIKQTCISDTRPFPCFQAVSIPSGWAWPCTRVIFNYAEWDSLYTRVLSAETIYFCFFFFFFSYTAYVVT